MEISVIELRIRNWIDDFGDGYGQVLAIDSDHYVLTTANDVPQPVATFKPIPISEELLIKAGFEKTTEFTYSSGSEVEFNVYKKGDLTYNSIQDAWWLRGVMDHYPKYLHQLQNLYFALTGKELNIEL